MIAHQAASQRVRFPAVRAQFSHHVMALGDVRPQFPWQGCLSRLLTLWSSFLNPTVLEAPHAHLKLDAGVTPLPGGTCILRTPATASPSALPAGWNNTGIASGRTRIATPCIPWRTQTSSCTGANGRAPYCRSVLSLSRSTPSRAVPAPFRTCWYAFLWHDSIGDMGHRYALQPMARA